MSRSPSGLLGPFCPWWDPARMLASQGVRSEHVVPHKRTESACAGVDTFTVCACFRLSNVQVKLSRCSTVQVKLTLETLSWVLSAICANVTQRLSAGQEKIRAIRAWISQVGRGDWRIWKCWDTEVYPRIKPERTAKEIFCLRVSKEIYENIWSVSVV